ncbi:MAG: hypothetical protein RL318_2725 [Fibrobacterota bacterium]|jgi:hypothetical protein
MNRQLLLFVCGLGAVAAAQTNLYGAGGLNYVPGAMPANSSGFGVSFASGVSSDPLRMSAVSSTWLDGRLEVSLSNTAWLVHDDSTGWNPKQTSLAPVVPGLKLVLDGDSSGKQAWGLAVGFGMPYGVWGAAEWRLHLPVLSPTVVAGLGTPVRTAYAFGGLRLDLCDLDARRLPVSLTLDGAMAGSTTTLGRAEESFVSVGVATRIGRNLAVQVTHRRDARYEAPSNRQNTGGTSLLQLVWNFQGTKVPTDREVR